MAKEKVANKLKKDKTKHQHLKTKIIRFCKQTMIYILRSIYFFLRYCLDILVDFLFSWYLDKDRKTIPDLEDKHYNLMLSAVSLAEKIRKKELKSVDLVTACIERIKQVNPILNAVTDERYEAALQDAREVDEKIENGLSEEEFKKQPFLGVPFTAKESHAVKGMLHTLGVKSRRNEYAEDDAECVRLLRAAGAIPVAVTNVPEINKWQETTNMVFGRTNNPYDTIRTVGGSSGGEAALSAALASPISLCSDIGGSTRMPAYFCGLFGYNPTPGHTSLKGSALRSGLDPTMASIGFVSKHCEDLVPLTKVVAGEKAHLLDLDREVNVKTLKFYYVDNVNDIRISPLNSDVKKTMKKVITRLAQQAVSPDKEPKPYYHQGFDYCFSLWRHAMTKETENFAKLLTNNKGEANGLRELGKKLIGQSDYTLAAILMLLDRQVLPATPPAWAERLTQSLAEDLAATLGDDGVLLFPSAASAAPPHAALFLRPYNFALWAVFNAIHFPSVQVPLGLNNAGLPMGVQVVAAPRRDALAVAAAARLEQHFGGYRPPCRVLH